MSGEPYVVFDIETNALESFDPKYRAGGWKLAPEYPHTIHCLVTREGGTAQTWVDVREGGERVAEEALGRHITGSIESGVRYLAHAAANGTLLVGHNVARFDLPALEHHYGIPIVAPGVRIFDTLSAATQMFFATLMARDVAMVRAAEKRAPLSERQRAGEARLPRRLWGANSLEAWGYRLRWQKGRFGSDEANGLTVEERFARLTPEMLAYCRNDVELNEQLYLFLRANGGGQGWPAPPLDAMVTESMFSWFIGQQERNGVGFNPDLCKQHVAAWSVERAEIQQRLRSQIPDWWVPASRKTKTPKRTQTRTKGEIAPKSFGEGCPYQEVKLVAFNPGSGTHVADRLITLFGWKPKAFTESLGWINGALRPVPETTKEALEDALDIPIVADLLRWQLLDTRIGQAAEGKKSWLNRVVDGEHGRPGIYGRQSATGTRTSRSAHHSPNVNIPKLGRPFGRECRECFEPTRPGWTMLGSDAAGIELRMLAHYLHPYDSGAFAEELLKGDTHTVTMNAVGYHSRDAAKEGRYADLYGCGDEKAGLIFLKHWRLAFDAGKVEQAPPGTSAALEIGRRVRERLTAAITGLAELRAACKKAHKRGYVRLLDGRVVKCDSVHGTLNDLLQGSAAVVIKWAVVRWWEGAERAGLRMWVDWAPMLQVHDEVDAEARTPEIAQQLGELFVASVKWAGERLGVRCPLDGSVAVGRNWKEVH